MNDSTLKKEFKKSDVERVRNLVNKDFTSKTKSQTGYRKTSKRYKEGEIWEESGKQWTIKNGLKQNITKLDSAKQAIKIPLVCPKCGKPMTSYIDKQCYKINNMCLDCLVDYEVELKKSGLWEQYLLHSRKGNLKYFIEEVEQKMDEFINEQDETYVTEQGDIESWNSNDSQAKIEMSEKLQEYITYLKSKLD
ncbi:hypothetical protein N8445_00185 [bacterium]|nr:hypothetical protein [bacterium]